MVIDRKAGKVEDRMFVDFPGLLRPDDVLVLNNTKVFPARLHGTTETGAKVEIFLVKQIDKLVWEALARPARRLSPGKRIVFSDDLTAEVVERGDSGSVTVGFAPSARLEDILDRIGKTPLPPYIKRETDSPDRDKDRYQTVFAKHRGSIAAPTAGLHFTDEALEAIRRRGVKVVEITLHVGYGTFEPVRVDDISEHRVSVEHYHIDSSATEILNSALKEKRRIIAVGTTTTRTLEACMTNLGKFMPGPGIADLTITPGYEFKAINGLVTNFHLPKSSLLILVSTFAGRQLIMKAYEHAVAERYRFYSYGDCMFIV
jgi:S-adenosylmethionine:tRNA ribosyltransferase-isomerase